MRRIDAHRQTIELNARDTDAVVFHTICGVGLLVKDVFNGNVYGYATGCGNLATLAGFRNGLQSHKATDSMRLSWSKHANELQNYYRRSHYLTYRAVFNHFFLIGAAAHYRHCWSSLSIGHEVSFSPETSGFYTCRSFAVYTAHLPGEESEVRVTV